MRELRTQSAGKPLRTLYDRRLDELKKEGKL
jgi:hypothetical protein